MPLIACVAVSVALHLLIIFSMRATNLGPNGANVQRPIEVRLPVAQSIPEVVVMESRPRLPQMAAETLAAEAAPTEKLGNRSKLPSGPDRQGERAPAIPFLASTLAAPLAFDESIFIPSAKLSVRPVPVGEILVPYPEGFEGRGLSKAILSLFIDEEGAVVRVNVDKSAVPVQFQEAATEVFARASFRPGEIDGRPVKSRMSIEVTFDSEAARRGTAIPPAR